MKPTQKLIFNVEGLEFPIRAQDAEPRLRALVERLHREGDEFGPVVDTINCPAGLLCVSVRYADARRAGQKKIFGFSWDAIQSIQQKGN